MPYPDEYIEEVRSGQIHPSSALRQLLDEMESIELSLDRIVAVFDVLEFPSGVEAAKLMRPQLSELRRVRSKALFVAKGVPHGESMAQHLREMNEASDNLDIDLAPA